MTRIETLGSERKFMTSETLRALGATDPVRVEAIARMPLSCLEILSRSHPDDLSPAQAKATQNPVDATQLPPAA